MGHRLGTPAGGGGMLLGNPHFPWIGQLRFSEVQLTTDDGLDVYGAMLLGLPGVGIGFTEGVAWTHTVSEGNRFTGYEMELAPGDPTSYVIDGEVVPMDSREITVEVLGRTAS
ncbi:MAG: penicillin acylase family protein [Microthrixaceae bacterium]